MQKDGFVKVVTCHFKTPITWVLRPCREGVLRILRSLDSGRASVIAFRSLRYIILIILLFHVIASLKFKRLIATLTLTVFTSFPTHYIRKRGKRRRPGRR